jgi:hypothetical protein
MRRPATFSIVDAIVGEASIDLPANSMFVAVLPVGELKCHWCPPVIKPYEEILLVRKEPPSARFAGHLIDVANLVKHLEDT